MPGDWDPAQYERFKTERARPFWDLVAMVVPGSIRRAVDLGCGTGELTAAAAEQLDVGEMLGIDTSPTMLDEADRRARPGLEFAHGDIGRWTSTADHDLVLSNAALHWVPHHHDVLARWVAGLRPGGQLAVQVPCNHRHASHTALVAVAEREPFASAFEPGGPPPDPVATNVLAPAEYAELLYELGMPAPDVQLRVYPHVLARSSDVVEWIKGSTLTRFLGRLPDELHEPLIDAYRAELLARVGDRAPYLFGFARILLHGRLPG